MKDCRLCKTPQECEGCESNVDDKTCRICGKPVAENSMLFCDTHKEEMVIEQFEAACSSVD